MDQPELDRCDTSNSKHFAGWLKRTKFIGRNK